MVTVEKLSELEPHVGSVLGVSRWVDISQAMVDRFGALTGDEHWIHVSPERAKVEGPYDGTIAQGFLTLSLLTGLLQDCFLVRAARRWVNYGLDKARFTAVVKPGQRVRLQLSLASYEAAPELSAKLRCSCEVQIDGSVKPALVVDFLMIGYE